MGPPLIIECSDQPLSLDFHPQLDHLLGSGLVDGTVELHDWRLLMEDDEDTILSSTTIFNAAQGEKDQKYGCRALSFSINGKTLYTGGVKGEIAALDTDRIATLITKESPDPHLYKLSSGNSPLQVVQEFSIGSQQHPLLVTANDVGGVQLWDVRAATKSTVQEYKVHDDYISALQQHEHYLLAASSDGVLSVYDIRMARQERERQKSIVGQSDNQDDELMSLQTLKHGKKVVCGTDQGVLAVWSWGTWGDVSDRFPGHPSSIDALLKVDEDTLLTGSADGLLRLVQVQPDKFLGVLGQQEDGLPMEELAFSAERSYVASRTHDCKLRLFDTKILNDDDSDDEDDNVDQTAYEEKQSDEQTKSPAALEGTAQSGNGSDDEWADMDEPDESCDDSDVSDDESTSHKKVKRLKTENEQFFEDL